MNYKKFKTKKRFLKLARSIIKTNLSEFPPNEAMYYDEIWHNRKLEWYVNLHYTPGVNHGYLNVFDNGEGKEEKEYQIHFTLTQMTPQVIANELRDIFIKMKLKILIGGKN